MQRACDGGCTTRFEFPCSSEARKENIQRRRNCRDPRYLMMTTSNCWSANKVHEHGQIVRFCHSVADWAWKHHWNTRKLWNNMFSVFSLVFASKCAIDACFAINLVQKDDLVFLGAKEASGRKLPGVGLRSPFGRFCNSWPKQELT